MLDRRPSSKILGLHALAVQLEVGWFWLAGGRLHERSQPLQATLKAGHIQGAVDLAAKAPGAH
jgi:hypothetical protein